MRILVLGSGAREHALARALAPDAEVLVAPGNAGIARHHAVHPVDPVDPAAVTALVEAERIGLVVVGPEAPLLSGVADALRDRGIAVFGPSAAAAELEGSKAFAKRIMAAAGVATGEAERCGTLEEVGGALDALGAPHVVKADGLAAGKGVLVTGDRDAALEHARLWLEHGPVLVERFLAGREVSLFCVTDGTTVLPLAPAQDFKRLGDGDAGPNTGGMGAYSPLPWLGDEDAFAARVVETVAAPVVRAMADRGTPFTGLLYCGLVVDGDDLRVIEFNARFGDPETQVVLPRLRTPLAPLLLAAATGTLHDAEPPRFVRDAAVGVVLAAEGYPGSPITGAAVTGLREAEDLPGVHVDVAALATVGDDLVSSGGRVLTVVGTGADVAAARDRAYEGLGRIRLPGGVSRTDIAADR